LRPWSCIRLCARPVTGPNSELASDAIASMVPSDSAPAITACAPAASIAIGASVASDE